MMFILTKPHLRCMMITCNNHWGIKLATTQIISNIRQIVCYIRGHSDDHANPDLKISPTSKPSSCNIPIKQRSGQFCHTLNNLVKPIWYNKGILISGFPCLPDDEITGIFMTFLGLCPVFQNLLSDSDSDSDKVYSTTRQIWGIWKLRLANSPETHNLGQNRWCFVPCDLEIWWMTLENNRASLLCCFKLCATFHSLWWIQTGVTVRKRPIWVKFDDF